MSLVEVFQADTGKLTRIDFVPDWDCSIIRSHTVSYRRAVYDFVRYDFGHDVIEELRKDFPSKSKLWHHVMYNRAINLELERRLGDYVRV